MKNTLGVPIKNGPGSNRCILTAKKLSSVRNPSCTSDNEALCTTVLWKVINPASLDFACITFIEAAGILAVVAYDRSSADGATDSRGPVGRTDSGLEANSARTARWHFLGIALVCCKYSRPERSLTRSMQAGRRNLSFSTVHADLQISGSDLRQHG